MNWQRIAVLVFLLVAAAGGLLGLLGIIQSGVVLGLVLLGTTLISGWAIAQINPAQHPEGSPTALAERLSEAERLRAARGRERAFYEVTSTLSSTLDSEKVLNAVQDVGTLIAKDSHTHMVSAALLFQAGKSVLKPVSTRGLTRNDEQVTVPGKEGVLGLALKQADPVFAGNANRDPELQYFAGFQTCKSVLAIPLRAGFDYYGVLVFGSSQPNAFSEDSVELLKAIGTQATIALQNAVLYHDILEEKERIVEVEEDARKKLARDLHDGPTQSIAAIAMRISYIRRLVGEKLKEPYEELGKVEELARRTTREIRHMLFTLRPLILETQGLTAALEQLAEKMQDTHNQSVIIEAQPGAERWLDSNAQGVVFYIIEEAVNNARKHAQAEHIWVRLYQRDTFLMIEIEDNGVGFNQAAVTNNYESRGSLGMVNMRERTEMVEGRLHIASTEGKGTKISVLVELKTSPTILANDQPTSPSKASALKRLSQKPTIPHASKRSPSS